MDFSKELNQILSYEEDALKYFQKKTYEKAYLDYKVIAKDFINCFKGLSDSEQNDAVASFISVFQEDIKSYTGFKVFQKSEAIRKHNMYMVSYVLPYFMEYNEESRKFAQAIAQAWPTYFKNCNIQAATYDDIKSGFVTRLFGTIVQN